MEGKIFTVTYEEHSYEISAMINSDDLCYELKFNGELLEKKMLKPWKPYYLFELERDGHHFLILIHKVKQTDFDGTTTTKYRFECFADGVSVSDGVTSLECFILDTEREASQQVSKPKPAVKEVLSNVIIGVAVFALMVVIARLIAFDSIVDAFFSILVDVILCGVLYCIFMIPYVLISKYRSRRALQKLCLRLRQLTDQIE